MHFRFIYKFLRGLYNYNSIWEQIKKYYGEIFLFQFLQSKPRIVTSWTRLISITCTILCHFVMLCYATEVVKNVIKSGMVIMATNTLENPLANIMTMPIWLLSHFINLLEIIASEEFHSIGYYRSQHDIGMIYTDFNSRR